MGGRSREMWIVLAVDAVGAALGAYLLYLWARPVSAVNASTQIDLVFPVLLAIAGLAVGLCQWWVVDLINVWLMGVVPAVVAGAPVLAFLSFVAQAGRSLPIPGGGQAPDPSRADLEAAWIYWAVFTLSALAALGLASLGAAFKRKADPVPVGTQR